MADPQICDMSPTGIAMLIASDLDDRYKNIRCEVDDSMNIQYSYGLLPKLVTYSGPIVSLYRNRDNIKYLFDRIGKIQIVSNAGEITGLIILSKDTQAHWSGVLERPNCFDAIYDALDTQFRLERR